jgi:hypothetical protein
MPKVYFVKKARKANPEHDIAVGDSYYWWQFAFRSKSYSKTPPKRQQLTQSDFMISVYALEDELAEVQEQEDAEDIASRIEELADEQEEKKSNMPEGLQEGDTGQLLEGRAESCREWAQNVESAASEYPEKEDGQTDEEYQEAVDAWREEVQALGYEGE